MKRFLTQVINGDKSLAFTFWGCFVFSTAILNLASIVTMRILIATQPHKDVNMVVYGAYAFDFFRLICIAAALIGVWRSASKYKGPYFWAALAKIVVVCNWIAIVIYSFPLPSR